MLADEHMRPWSDHLLELMQGERLFDAHAHIGFNDPDGFKFDAAAAAKVFAETGSRALLIPMHEPHGYRQANDDVVAAARESDGRFVAFCRVSASADCAGEVERAVSAGAAGIKLHPRSDAFRLDDPTLDAVFAFADERRLPVIVHAGRGMPALGTHALERCRSYPRAQLILAHAGVSDLSRLVDVVAAHPNLFFDTSCFAPADLLMLFALVPPGRILFASDVPYATSVQGVIFTFRCALQAGLTDEQVRCVAGEQLQRLVDREPAVDIGPAVGPARLPADPVLERAHGWIMLAIGQLGTGGTGERPIGLARLACDVGDDHPRREVCRSVVALLDRHDTYLREREAQGIVRSDYSHLHLLGAAAVVAKTPDVPVPTL